MRATSLALSLLPPPGQSLAAAGQQRAHGRAAASLRGRWRAAVSRPASGMTSLLSALETEPPYLQGLNEEQRAVVLADLCPLRVLAGPGSGKTRVLTSRVAHLTRTLGAEPSSVLCITFTKKAAAEMRERLDKLLGPAGRGVACGTFHNIVRPCQPLSPPAAAHIRSHRPQESCASTSIGCQGWSRPETSQSSTQRTPSPPCAPSSSPKWKATASNSKR